MWWVQLRDNPAIGRAIWPPNASQSRFLHSDANETGWGAVFAGSLPARGMFSRAETTLHINEKELLAVIYGVLAFADRLLPGQHICQWVDSSVAAANVYNWTARSPVALALLRIFRRLLEDLGLSMSTQRLPSVLNLLSDRLSRTRPADDWRLTPDAQRSLARTAGPPLVHHFALRHTALSERYTSRLADPYAEGLSFEAPWQPGDILTPPPHALPLVFSRLRASSHNHVVLVAPNWPAQPWYSQALALAAQSWLLPFPTWKRAARPSPWFGRAFLFLSDFAASRRDRVPASQRLGYAGVPAVKPPSDPVSEQRLAPLLLESSLAPPSRHLPLPVINGTGSAFFSTVPEPASVLSRLQRKQFLATSDIYLSTRRSLAAACGSTWPQSLSGTSS